MNTAIAIAALLSLAQVDAGTSAEPVLPPHDRPVAVAAAPEAPPPAEGPNLVQQAIGHWWEKVTFGGFGRIGLFYTFPFRDDELVGGNGGFRVADARLNIGFNPVRWADFQFSIEAAAPLANETDPTSGQRIVSLRDWYADLKICRGFNVRAGQFRPPYYAEMLQADGMLPFVSRSVLAEGYTPPDAYGPRRNIVLDRQVGVQAYSNRLGNDTVGFKYALGVFNGNGPNQLFNDNNAVTPVGRVEFDLFEKVTLAGNAFYNSKSDGIRPNRVTVNQLGYGADLTAKIFGLRAIVGYVGNSYTYGATVLPPDSSMGIFGQLHYVHEGTGIEGAIRYAFLEPSSAQIDDKVQEVSAMIGYRPFKGPIRVVLQYEHREEEAAVAIANDSVILFLHAFF